MFAFAFWDDTHGRLTIARDRIGKKPLYYVISDGCLYFASSRRALGDGDPARYPIDTEALDAYLTLSYIPAPRTIYPGIRKLEAATRKVQGVPEFVAPEIVESDDGTALMYSVPLDREAVAEDARKARSEGAEGQQRFADQLGQRLSELIQRNEQRLGEMRATLEQRLRELQAGNEAKLEQMRATVDEKLQSTLETRLGESFRLVSERLEHVQRQHQPRQQDESEGEQRQAVRHARRLRRTRPTRRPTPTLTAGCRSLRWRAATAAPTTVTSTCRGSPPVPPGRRAPSCCGAGPGSAYRRAHR